MRLSKSEFCCIKSVRSFITILFVSSKWSAESKEIELNPETYALSPIYLKILSKQERDVYHGMRAYSETLEKRLQLIQRYTTDYEVTTMEGTKSLLADTEKDAAVSESPILAFRMLSRLAHEFAAIGHHMSQNAEEATSKIVFGARGSTEFPTPADVRDAMDGILRFQFVNDVKAEDISNGQIPRSSNNLAAGDPVGLNTRHCFAFGKAAKRRFQYTLALDWFNVTGSRLATEPNALGKFGEHMLKTAISATVAEHDEEHESNYKESYEHIYVSPIGNPESPRPKRLVDSFEDDLPRMMLNESDPGFYQKTLFNHLALCKGRNFQERKGKSQLRCWNDYDRNPYWKVNPLKMELLNHFPPIMLIHDVIGEKWANHLKEISYSNLERAPTGPAATPRTAAYAWFKDSDLKGIELSRRIELITGLNVVGEKASELLQIAAYAFGGHVDLHYDSKGPDDPNVDPKGERLMTFLLYLNDVNNGGLTSFPKLGFSVKPVRGSALVWYTNLRNGNLDPLTLHGACPLISGHKWIATKWIHINENFLKRPCGLDPSL